MSLASIVVYCFVLTVYLLFQFIVVREVVNVIVTSRREIRIRHRELFSGQIKLSELGLKIGYNGVANNIVVRRI